MNSSKPLVYIGLLVGSTIGGLLPGFWGDTNIFSMSSILLGGAGGIIGIFLGFKYSQF